MSVDLTTTYLGLKLKSPLVVSACPLTGDLDTLRRLEEAGAGAAVLPSLFEEQIVHDERQVQRLYEYHAESYVESLTKSIDLEDYNTGPDAYLHHIRTAKQITTIPLIGSLNGSSAGGWTEYAKAIEAAGADALELNVYFVPTDPVMTSADVEQWYVNLVMSVRREVTIPLAVKLGPNFSSLPNFARRLADAGADGLVLFNRYLEPEVDLTAMQIRPELVLSSRHELRAPLRWIAILRDQLPISLAATSGIHFTEDVIKALLVGADVTMMAAVLLRYGPRCLTKMTQELEHWLQANDYDSVAQLRGSLSRGKCPDPSALERAHYMKALTSFAKPNSMR